jgi:hypothetical protein
MKLFIHLPRQFEPYFYIADHLNYRIMLSKNSGFSWYIRIGGDKHLSFNVGAEDTDEILWQFGPLLFTREGEEPEE